jgi:hypothetical protein
MGDPSVRHAIELASSEYSALQWAELPQGYRAEAIYSELRRLDAEAMAGARERLSQFYGSSPNQVPQLELVA